jgi:uncharacterized protein HemY
MLQKVAAAHVRLGSSLRRLGSLSEAGLELEKAMSLGEDSIQVWAELGLVFAAQGEEEAALVCQRKVSARSTSDGEKGVDKESLRSG